RPRRLRTRHVGLPGVLHSRSGRLRHGLAHAPRRPARTLRPARVPGRAAADRGGRRLDDWAGGGRPGWRTAPAGLSADPEVRRRHEPAGIGTTRTLPARLRAILALALRAEARGADRR